MTENGLFSLNFHHAKQKNTLQLKIEGIWASMAYFFFKHPKFSVQTFENFEK